MFSSSLLIGARQHTPAMVKEGGSCGMVLYSLLIQRRLVQLTTTHTTTAWYWHTAMVKERLGTSVKRDLEIGQLRRKRDLLTLAYCYGQRQVVTADMFREKERARERERERELMMASTSKFGIRAEISKV